MSLVTKVFDGERVLGFLERFRSKVARLTFKEAAGRAGVSTGTWKDWETGRRPVPLEKISVIEAALGVDDGSMKTGKLWEWRVQEVLEGTVGRVNSRKAVSAMVEMSLRDYLELLEGGSLAYKSQRPPDPLPAADLQPVTVASEDVPGFDDE